MESRGGPGGSGRPFVAMLYSGPRISPAPCAGTSLGGGPARTHGPRGTGAGPAAGGPGFCQGASAPLRYAYPSYQEVQQSAPLHALSGLEDGGRPLSGIPGLWGGLPKQADHGPLDSREQAYMRYGGEDDSIRVSFGGECKPLRISFYYCDYVYVGIELSGAGGAP